MRLVEFTTKIAGGWMNPTTRVDVQVLVNPDHVVEVYKIAQGGSYLLTTVGKLEVAESIQTVWSRLETGNE